MPADPGLRLVVRSARDLERLADALRDAGNRDLRLALLRRIREANKDTLVAVRANALATLPRRGGLAQRIADGRLSTRTRLAGKSVGVQIVGRNAYALRILNAGRLRHPVFGDDERWVEQKIPRGWFTDPIKERVPQNRRAVVDAVNDIKHEIEKRA